MAQYKNVLAWLDKEYLVPAQKKISRVVESNIPENSADTGDYAELKEIEEILDKALDYVRCHQK